MWYNLYESVHNSLGMHFWEVPALIAGAVIVVELVVHSVKQKKREDRFNKEREEKLEELANGTPGGSATA